MPNGIMWTWVWQEMNNGVFAFVFKSLVHAGYYMCLSFHTYQCSWTVVPFGCPGCENSRYFWQWFRQRSRQLWNELLVPDKQGSCICWRRRSVYLLGTISLERPLPGHGIFTTSWREFNLRKRWAGVRAHWSTACVSQAARRLTTPAAQFSSPMQPNRQAAKVGDRCTRILFQFSLII